MLGTMSKGPTKEPPGCRPGSEARTTLRAIVDDYIATKREKLAEELGHYAALPSLETVISAASECLVPNTDKRHSHQQLIPEARLWYAFRAMPL